MKQNLKKIIVEVVYTSEIELLNTFQEIYRTQRYVNSINGCNYKFHIVELERSDEETIHLNSIKTMEIPPHRYETHNGKTVLIIESRLNSMP